MTKNKVAIQGELGAYSHIACNEFFKSVEIKTCSTFEETFKVAYDDDSYKIIIPLENSLAGRVADIHYLLPKYKLQIHAEHFQRVEHNLLARPESSFKDIKYVRSHAQAIGQCQSIIIKNKFKTIISADTAGSAKDLSEGKDKSIAAIASKLSAEIYKLKILKENIEDEKDNVTRFLIMGKNILQPALGKKRYITSFLFKLKSKPAALYQSLGGFAINGVNLTKLQSYPEKNSFNSFFFLCDLDGHIEDQKVQKSLEELGLHCEDFHVLGVFEADSIREKKS